MDFDSKDYFCFERRVQFSEADPMGVVHHAQYLHFFEEARIAWLMDRKLEGLHYPNSELVLGVLSTECQHLKPAFVFDELKVFLQVRRLRLKVEFRYVIFAPPYQEPVARGKSLHVMMNSGLKVVRPPKDLTRTLEKETWTEI